LKNLITNKGEAGVDNDIARKMLKAVFSNKMIEFK